MLGITAGDKKGKSRMRWMIMKTVISELSTKDMKKTKAQDKSLMLTSENHNQEEETDQCIVKEKPTGNHCFENAAEYIRKDRQES